VSELLAHGLKTLKREIAILFKINISLNNIIITLTTRRTSRITPPLSLFKGREANIVKKTKFY
jgi:hypothetical protein